MARLPDYADFPVIARRNRWDADAIGLAGDAELWRRLEPATTTPIAGLLAGFLVGERAVAVDIRPFHARAPNEDVARCFAAQAVDEDRHRRFFDRVHAEVLGDEGDTALVGARRRLPRAFLDLFECELAGAAARLASDANALAPAVALYHGLLEGVVFLAGQAELLARLEESRMLPAVADGVRRVQRDERWHVAFGARLLADSGDPLDPEAVLADAIRVLGSWGSLVRREICDATVDGFRRRVHAAGLVAAA